MSKRFILLFLTLSLAWLTAGGERGGDRRIVTGIPSEGSLVLASAGRCAPMYISHDEWPGVIRAFRDLQNDLGSVTGTVPGLSISAKVARSDLVIIAGTIGRSSLITQLATKGKIDTVGIKDKWESFIIQTVERPFPGVRQAVVIAGSDRRGTIYGIYEISRQAGVSPWYWWADIPARRSSELYVTPGRYQWGEPSVRYRGIFLNDEYPALTRWVAHRYGEVIPSVTPPVPPGVANYGSSFYTRIFELLLRLKANYLWPAMWNNAFNEDDPANAFLADEYGIVMGTTHQEPMLRAQKEWDRRYRETLGYWSWSHHADTLMKFWRDGIRRNKNYESIITIGLRGADDTEMEPGGAEANIVRLEEIVRLQREMIAEEVSADLTRVPQLWCLYKEVQDYYHTGMRVPEDVTLLWAEDNWGNVRRLPTADERGRRGGAGIYYHFDYHGGPRSYQWINTSPVPKIWDQMTLARQYGADRIWIVNAGHFRGYEIPVEYFLTLAWDTDALAGDATFDWTKRWAAEIFGQSHAAGIAEIIRDYTRYNGRRKPELLTPFTYSLINYNEAESVVGEYNALAHRAEAIAAELPPDLSDAYFHLVLFPVKACATVNELYLAAGKNALYASQGRAATAEMAERTRRLFTADTTLMGYYNRIYADGRWKHFMDQAHLGYIAWDDPPVNSLRHLTLESPPLPHGALPALAVEGSAEAWPLTTDDQESTPTLPMFDIFNRQRRYFEIFNRGDEPFRYRVMTDAPWIAVSEPAGTITTGKRIEVSIDWPSLPHGEHHGSLTLMADDRQITLGVTAFSPATPDTATLKGFVESDGYISMEAGSYTSMHNTGKRAWEWIEDYGRTRSGLRTRAETDAPAAVPGKDAPWLEYNLYLFSAGEFETVLYMAPSLNFLPDRDFKIGVSIDDNPPELITVVPAGFNAENGNREWEETVMNSIRYVSGKITVSEPGYHTLKIWMIDPGMVLEKIVIDTGGVRPSYLGPPESYNRFRE